MSTHQRRGYLLTAADFIHSAADFVVVFFIVSCECANAFVFYVNSIIT